MIRKKLISLLVLLVVLASVAVAQESEFKLINALNYHKGMFAAQQPEVLMKIPFGAAAEAVGGAEQDLERYTPGVPFAFRPVADGKVWVLDSVNKALKLFGKDGALLQNISLQSFGALIRDFAFDGDKGFWLLNPVDGFIYRIDLAGKMLSRIEGFADARAIETGMLGELLIDMPTMSSILRFGKNELLKEQYPCDEGLSMIEGVGGKLLALEMNPKKVSLLLRNVASPAQNLDLTEFPLEIADPAVTYAGAKILGHDQAGNIYLNLVACHDQGAIYRDRIYKCSPTGKILAQKDILSVPYMAPDLPRDRVVTPDGQVMSFYTDENAYILSTYSL